MDKNKWEDLHNNLDKIYSDFYEGYKLSENGSNKNKRNDGKRKVDNAILLARNNIENFPEVIPLISEGNPYLYAEFFLPRYFYQDMPKLLSKIKEKISSLN